MDKSLVFYKKEKRLVSRLLLFLMLFQMFFTAFPISVYADSKASIEIVVKNNGNPVSNGKIKIAEQGVRDLTFIKENGVYKADSSGYYKEITTGSQGDVIVSGLDIGVYTILYLNGDKTQGAMNFNIESKSDFKQIDFNLGDDENSGSNDLNVVEDNEDDDSNDNDNNIATSSDMYLKFNSSGVEYRVEDSSGRRLSFVKTNKGYALGGNLKYIESGSDVRLSAMDHGKYSIIGQGKKYTINLNNSNNKFSISDKSVEEEVIEEVLETGSLNLSIRNKKTREKFKGVPFEILNESGSPVNLKRVTDNQYIYDENGNVDKIVHNDSNIKILDLPVGDYTIIDASDGGSLFDDVEVAIKENKTAIVNVEKDPLENDLMLELELDTESDIELGKDDKFIFSVEDADGISLTFKKKDKGYVYDEEGEKEIEITSKGVELLDIPAGDIVLSLIEAPKTFEDEIEKIEIDLTKDDEYTIKVELIKYVLELISEENSPVEGVVVSILNSKEKEVASAMSDSEGVLEFEGLEEEESYKAKVMSVPSPYALPNQGQDIDVKVSKREVIVEKVDNSPILMGSHEEDNSKDKDKDKDDKSSKVDKDKDLEPIREASVLKIPFAEFIARSSSGKEGSIFSFVDKNGEEVYRLISEEGGEIGVNKINHGEYVVTQLTVADGHKISEEKYKLVVDGNYVSEIYTFHNPKIGESDDVQKETPKKDKTIAIVLIILVIFFAFINLYISNQRYKEEHGENKYKVFDKIDKLLGGDEEFDSLTEDELDEYEDDSIDEEVEIEPEIEPETETDISNDDTMIIDTEELEKEIEKSKKKKNKKK